MQRLKLYHKLEIQQSKDITPCCSQDLEANDEDIELVETCFTESSNLNEEERSSLYYISGYVAYKEGLGIPTNESATTTADSEFLRQVSRGKLSHPPQHLFDIS